MLKSFGALPCNDGVRFRIPATDARELAIILHDGRAAGRHVLRERDADGVFETVIPGAAAGDWYSCAIDGGPPRPDPASRFQPDGVHGACAIVDPRVFPWTDGTWRGRSARELIVYELHVGTFSPEGTYAGARDRLPALRDLGVTAVELMPLADFPGGRNWGYDGVCLFAPARAYGRPDDLRAFVDRAHQLGIAVILDVVYNHLGPEGAYLHEFMPRYLTGRHHTPWGGAVNLDGHGSRLVRAFITANVAHWVREYHLDGLRLDATHALVDESPVHILAEIGAAARRQAAWPVHIHAEDDRSLAVLIDDSPGGLQLDGAWADDFHHAIRRHLAGDCHGYFSRYAGDAGEIATTIRDGWLVTPARGTDPSCVPMRRFIVCLQNHDQIGNRALGDRLHHTVDAAAWRAATVLLLTVPMTPLLFMGQEWAASTPFQFFTDMPPSLGALVTEGRRLEFAAFPAFADAAARDPIPDPQAPATFEASRLRWEERDRPPHRHVLDLYRALIDLRRREPALAGSEACAGEASAPDDDTVVMCRRGEGAAFWIAARLTRPGTVRVPAAGRPRVVLSSEDAAFAPDPAPPIVETSPDGTTVRFHRAGAVILRA